jgi:hypothetical protein
MLLDRVQLLMPERNLIDLARFVPRAMRNLNCLHLLSVSTFCEIDDDKVQEIHDELVTISQTGYQARPTFMTLARKISNQTALWNEVWSHYPDMPQHEILMNLIFNPDDELLSKLPQMGGGGVDMIRK